MTIVPYSEVNQEGNVALRGRRSVTHIDLSSGHVFDANGNTVGRWDAADDSAKVQQKSTMAAQYAAQYTFASSCYAMSTVDPERAKHMLSAAEREDISNPVHLLELGTSDVHIPSALPNIAMGYRNEAPMADIYSPPVMTPKPSDYYYVFDKNDAFQRAYPSGGTGGGQVNEISPRLSSTLFTTTERALGGFVSTQLESAADVPLRILQATTKRVMNAMLIEREIRVQSLARTSSNWNSNNFATIPAGFQWNGGASADPLKDLQNRQEQSLGGITGVIMTLPTWNAFVRSPSLSAFFKFKDRTKAMPTMQEIQSEFGLPPIFVSKMRYINSSGVPTYIWGNDVVLFRQPEETPPTTQDDIASSYSFRWNLTGRPADAQMAAGGFIVRQYYDQNRGSLGGVKCVVVHQDAEVQTSGYVGGLLINAYQ